jgi:peptidoglycan/LPS O-acetylase OafA/YrhL
MPSIDRLRVLAAFGIVWFHTENAKGVSIGYAGLPMFIMIFCALCSRQIIPEAVLPYSNRKARRLLMPWLFWSAVFLGVNFLKVVIQNREFSATFKWHMLITGPSIHLWFLPYAFAAALIVNMLQRWANHIRSNLDILLSVICGIILLFGCSVLLQLIQVPVPFCQWIFGLPAIILGFCIGRVYAKIPKQAQWMFYCLIACNTGIICLLLIYFDYSHLAVPYGIATVLLCAAFLWKGGVDTISQKCALLTYGIYLIHPLVGSVLHYGGARKADPWLMMVVVFLLSFVVTWAIKQTPLKQFV